MRLRAGDAEAGRNPDQQRNRGREFRHDDAVPEIQPHGIFGKDLNEIGERGWMRHEYRRIRDVVDLVLERERQHPQKHEDRGRNDDRDRECKASAAKRALQPKLGVDLPSRGAGPYAQVHLVLSRTCSKRSASARMIIKNTTTTAEAL